MCVNLILSFTLCSNTHNTNFFQLDYCVSLCQSHIKSYSLLSFLVTQLQQLDQITCHYGLCNKFNPLGCVSILLLLLVLLFTKLVLNTHNTNFTQLSGSCNLIKLPESISRLNNLTYLDVCFFSTSNKEFQVYFDIIQLSNCSSLKELPFMIGELINLTSLDVFLPIKIL